MSKVKSLVSLGILSFGLAFGASNAFAACFCGCTGPADCTCGQYCPCGDCN